MFPRTSPSATHPLEFGRSAKSRFNVRPLISSDDLRLFGMTFAAGFVAVSILIA